MPFTLDEVDYSNLFCLFKGEPGTRKSTCALSFPKPIYFFDYDQKMDALKIPCAEWGLNPKEVVADRYDTWDAGKTQLEKFQVSCKYKTIVIDSLTSIADAINRQTRRIKQSDKGGKVIAGIPVNSIEDFNAEDSALSEMVSMLKYIRASHKINVIIIAHIIRKDQKTEDGKTHIARTLLTAGKGIAQKIPAYCSEVYHFNIKPGAIVGKGGQYALLTTHTGDDFARTSLKLPEEIVFGNDPLYEKYIKPYIPTNQQTKEQTNADISVFKA